MTDRRGFVLGAATVLRSARASRAQPAALAMVNAPIEAEMEVQGLC